jgi:hypothetical protein
MTEKEGGIQAPSPLADAGQRLLNADKIETKQETLQPIDFPPEMLVADDIPSKALKILGLANDVAVAGKELIKTQPAGKSKAQRLLGY